MKYNKNISHLLFLFVSAIVLTFIFSGCKKSEISYPTITRLESIPADAVKMTPETDQHPPILHSSDWEEPVPMPGPVNTAGGEDSPFIPADRDELYFFFTPDVSIPAEEQITDSVTGIYVSKFLDNQWQEPTRVWLQEPGKLALDGAEFVQGNEMLFVSAREGYVQLKWFKAFYENDKWTNRQVINFDTTYQVGELHIHNDELYYHSYRAGGKGQLDIWKLTKISGEWKNPVNVEAVNTAESDGFPYITPDGNELWFNRTYQGSPAIYRSVKADGGWQTPELIISQFAGEPTLDKNGNIYFVHHFYVDGEMVEADIYVAYKK
jgi:hypothetical protein